MIRTSECKIGGATFKSIEIRDEYITKPLNMSYDNMF